MAFFSDREIKATRKRHRCGACDQPIEAGMSALYYAGMCDGEFSTAYFHVDCRAAEIAFNSKIGMFWDEWVRLADIDEDEDWNWLAEKHPAVFARIWPKGRGADA